jgi:hypothetical protein
LDKEQVIIVREPDPPAHLMRNTVGCCRSAAFSAARRLFGLNGAANTARVKNSGAIIAR